MGPVRDAATTGPDGATVTIQEIMDSCNISIERQGRVLGCLATMDSEWNTGIAAALAGQDCRWVASALECSPGELCANQQFSRSFDPTYPRICEPMLIYTRLA